MTKKHYILLPSPLHESYQIKFKDGATEIGPTINIEIEKAPCPPVTLMWLNSKGGWDSFAFNPKRDEELQSLKTISQKQSTELTANQRSIDAVASAKTGVLTSEFLDKDSLELVSGVIESPVVYLIHLDNGAYNYLPVIINTQKLPALSRGLISVEISYSLSFERLNQNSLNVQPLIPAPINDVEWENLWS